MPPTVSRFAVLALLTLALSATFGAQNVTSDLTAHEWGTFTSIAGRDGQAVKWSPLNRSTGLRATFSFRQFQSGFTGHSPHGDACPLLLFPARSDGIREGQVLQRSIYGVVSRRQPHRAGSPVFSGSEGALRTA